MKVLYVAGYGRSGTTLLDRSLGQTNGVLSLGELALAGRVAADESHTCSCGEELTKCSLWREIPSFPPVPSEHLGLLLPVPRMKRKRVGSRAAWSRFFDSIEAALDDTAVIVDSSKTTYARAARPWLLAAEGHAVFPVLIWRDLPSVLESRAAARSARGERSMSWVVLAEGFISWTFANVVGLIAVWKLKGRVIAFDDLVDDKDELANWLVGEAEEQFGTRVCLLYTSPSPRDRTRSRMPSSA